MPLNSLDFTLPRFTDGEVWLSYIKAERELATENARLKRQLAEQAEELAILKKAAAYFAKSLK
ncbi:hypothetical protein GL2_03280 [Microbulbifer sp. GL-2]|nr:hypothetical protein GL2_03280 [Microbulbifer sp. GL-2]